MPSLGEEVKEVSIIFSRTKRLAKKLERKKGPIKDIEKTLFGHQLLHLKELLSDMNKTLKRETEAP